MNRMIRISSAAVGMFLLAGLAYYQGDMDPGAGQQEILAGTAISETVDKTSSPEIAETQPPECDQANDPNHADHEACSDKNL